MRLDAPDPEHQERCHVVYVLAGFKLKSINHSFITCKVRLLFNMYTKLENLLHMHNCDLYV